MQKLTDEYTLEYYEPKEGESEESRGAEVYRRNGLIHRDDDLPAVIYVDGSKFWYRDGASYREGDKPANEYACGSMYWYFNGQLGRADDKPACVWPDGVKAWYMNGEMHRDNDLPAVETIDNEGVRTFAKWCSHGETHRDTRDENGHLLPAIWSADGSREWVTHGKFNRPLSDGPAVINEDGTVEYWVNGERVE